MRRSSTFIKALLASIAILAVVKLALNSVREGPSPTLVEDEARLFTAEQAERLTEYHRFLLKDHGIDYRVLTATGVDDIARFSIARFEEMDVGGESTGGRGLLLVIDAGQDAVRLEVSRSLEGVFTDAFVTYIQERQMVPFFRYQKVADGILATTEMIYTEAQKAEKNFGFDEREQQPGAAGAGAGTRAHIGQGESGEGFAGENVAAGKIPEATVMAYLRAMAEGNANPGLDLFTASTREMLANWTVTPAQMDNIVNSYRACHAEPAKLNGAGNLAVIRYPPGERACAPWFLEKQAGLWRLDLTMMQRAVRFGRSNAWHFDMAVAHPYRFAFGDWRFDSHGFPRTRG